MEKVKVKDDNLSKFLNTWDKEIVDLNLELRKISIKQKKEQLVIRKKEGFTFRLNK
jgi:hypothetical protein|tara:strand:+ start:158 stop:325 length:168 start_codon:yes stop_codon:yes gene_type:complete